ncbi:hypothetical protein AQ962_06785 [Burkholderia pseudomallei]|nr:hypothetical protein ACT79_22670 [Burkholderia pseudomallei]ANW49083.1 hypothetical protein A7U58_02605 [Burkholderia pseudomallei]ANW55116.1 hypothetical protein A7U59_02615 [Burkholderia pseudomallei]KKI74665.1 hypothetical protein VU09_16545 [Burkholderia pseudomallei]OMR13761.1 hypothetical protein AQ718_18985 [Burkholderia pseudomallei]
MRIGTVARGVDVLSCRRDQCDQCDRGARAERTRRALRDDSSRTRRRLVERAAARQGPRPGFAARSTVRVA